MPDDHGRGRGGGPARADGRCRLPGLRHRRSRRRAQPRPPTRSRSTARCRRTGPCSTVRAQRVRPTSRSWATKRRSREQIDALAAIGVTDFIASVFGSRDERDRTYAFLATLTLNRAVSSMRRVGGGSRTRRRGVVGSGPRPSSAILPPMSGTFTSILPLDGVASSAVGRGLDAHRPRHLDRRALHLDVEVAVARRRRDRARSNGRSGPSCSWA